MTAALSLEVRRRSPLNREELRRQLLALVLTAVLVWYTLVVPAHAGPRSSASLAPDDEGLDGEVRDAGHAPPAGRGKPQPPERVKQRPAEDLDWPEYIYP
ncbi:MAG TPA: hypothetical protein VF611_01270 [Pyrinomonadaceae bacterium]|jgi:hypothetical protein